MNIKSLLKQRWRALALMLLCHVSAVAQTTDVSTYFLENHSFDTGFNYTAGQTKAVTQEILDIDGWTADFSMNFTITGIYEFGFAGTYNGGTVPATGYDGEAGGGLALSTGWSCNMIYYQTVILPAGTYTITVPTYNGKSATAGTSLLAWLPQEGDSVRSTVAAYPYNEWTKDEISFSLTKKTTGRIQIGYQAAGGGSASSANLLIDYVRIVASDMVADKSDLQTALDDADSLLNVYASDTTVGADDLKAAVQAAQTVEDNADASMIDILKVTKQLKEAMSTFRYLNVSDERPFPLTKYIKNPSFEESGVAKWTATNFVAQSNKQFTLLDGNVYVEKWVSRGLKAGDGKVSQIISLPLGRYKLTVSAANFQQNDATMQCTGMAVFGDDRQTPIAAADDYSVSFVNLTDEVEVGVVAENATGNWLTVDNFRLSLVELMTDELLANDLARRVAEADVLNSEMMSATTREALNAAIATLRDTPFSLSDEATLSTAVKALSQAISDAKASIKEYDALEAAIAEASAVYDETLNGAEELQKVLQEATAVATDANASSSDISAQVEAIATAQLLFLVANGSGTVPTVTTFTDFMIPAVHGGLVRATFEGENIIERGICWSTDTVPTLADHRETTLYSLNGYLLHIKGMKPAQVYYARPYAITDTYAVGYGEAIKVVTLPAGNCTGTWNEGAPTAEANTRCRNAIQNAISYLNEWTGLRGFRLTGTYGSGTPTADCGYGGSMRIGPGSAYQATGTVMHEMGHGVGVGTHYRWYSCADTRASTKSGKWLGAWANKTLQFLENRMDDEAVFMTGDAVHGWASSSTYDWFVNGAGVDKHTALQYIGCAAIYHGLFVDGLCPTTAYPNGMAAYTFDINPGKTYYIKCESAERGLDDGFLSYKGTSVVWKKLTKDEVTDNEKWYVEYNPASCTYQFRNVATGTWLTHPASGSYMSLKNTTTPSATENFTLMPGRNELTVDNDVCYGTERSYWFSWQDGSAVKAMSLNAYSATTGIGTAAIAGFNFSDAATTQRYLLIPTDTEVILPEVDETLPDTLANADFEQGTAITAPGICTYDYDMSTNNTSLSMLQEVEGWTIASNGNGRSAGTYAYGSGKWLGTTAFVVPSAAPEESGEQQALGVVAVWSSTAQYTQEVTLGPGDYTLTFLVQNVGGTGAMSKNLCGFLTNGGVTYLASATTYPVGEWVTETVSFSLRRTTTGTVSLGYAATNSGSVSAPHLFFERVELKRAGDTPDDITDITRSDAAPASREGVWDLSGRQVKDPSSLSKGIYVVNGKKMIVR